MIITQHRPAVIDRRYPRPPQATPTLMTDVLKQRANIILRRLLPKQMILNLAHRTLRTIVREMIPRASITIQHRLRLDELLTIFAALALEGIVSVAAGLVIVQE